MHVIARPIIHAFITQHADARGPLEAWYKTASAARWNDLVQIRATYPHADAVGRLMVFNMGGGKFRLVARVIYASAARQGTVFIRHILTHAEYDKEQWKRDPWF